jgi:hypothetical protein
MGILLRSGTKFLITVVLAIVLFVGAFVVWPDFILGLQDTSAWIIDQIGRPGFLEKRELALYRQFVTENTILGILVTAIARAIVEVIAYLVGLFSAYR